MTTDLHLRIRRLVLPASIGDRGRDATLAAAIAAALESPAPAANPLARAIAGAILDGLHAAAPSLRDGDADA